MEQVVLVDENDQELGVEEKILAHQNGGELHRAFSIFIFNSKGQMMSSMQSAKYEDTEKAAHRRLKEEMGFDCELSKKTSFIYKVPLDNDMTEHEFLHVFVGNFDGIPNINADEAMMWKWIDIDALEKDIKENSQNYTPWFIMALPKIIGDANPQISC